MHTSATAILIIVVVVVVALAIWLIAVMRAARRPGGKPRGTKLLGPVQGGIHVGGGRSVAPRRDEAVDPDQVPDGDTITPVLRSTKDGPDQARRGSGNPLDL
ncbi:MAG TPA: hypothetical protein VH021_15850 [Trebonia sp.]|jgi:cytoskeletal protein RodZ|nr:hypothetical protein [Trebonia sp.]